MPVPDIKKTVCEICLNNCGIDAWVEDGKLVKVEGSVDCFNRGKLCVKGYASREYLYREDRIETPLRRVGPRGAGNFEPISWDEAYTEIAKRLNTIKAESGADSVAFYAGYSKWFRTMFHRFAHSFGTLNYGTESSACFQAVRLADTLNAGSLSRPDVANTDLFLAWGFNPFYSSVYHADTLEALQEKGLKIISIDPRITPFSQLADIHLPIKAGTDGALALFFGRCLIEHDAIDHVFVAEHIHGYEEYRTYVQEFTNKKTAQITGVDPKLLEQAVALLLANPRFTISEGAAPLTHHKNGVQNFRAIMALSAISGNYDSEGGNIPTEFADQRINADSMIGDEHFIQAVRPSAAKPKIGSDRFPVWSEIIDEFQAMDLSRNIIEGTPYPIRALFALGMNARMFPGNEDMFKALETVEFFVDVDIFMNDTARFADIVLPACTSFERSQFQGGFMGHYNPAQAIRYLSPVVQPLFESKSDADILCELAEYLELDDDILRSGYDACSRAIMQKVGTTFGELRLSAQTTRIPGLEPYHPGDNTRFGYRTPTGKFELQSEILRKHGFDALPIYQSSTDDADQDAFPFQLTAGARLPYEFHSRFQNSTWKKIFRAEPLIDINPDDAATLNIEQRDLIELATLQGSVRAQANLTYAVSPGAVFLYQDYVDADANTLLASDHLDPISGFPGYRSIRCRIKKESRSIAQGDSL